MILDNSAASQLLMQGQVAEAASLCESLLAQNPSDGNALNTLACARASQQRFQESIAMLRGLTQAAPEWPIGHYNLGLVCRIVGDIQGALGEFRTAAQLDPNFAEAQFEFGRTVARHLNQTKLYPESQERLRTATRLRPEWAEAHYELGRHLIHSSATAEAQTALQRALELNPNIPDAHFNLAVALMEEDKPEEAVPHLEATLAADPNHAEARRNLDRLKELKRSKRERLARYPRSHKEFDDLQKVIDTYIMPEFRNQRPVINRSSQILTLGSCFAANIAEKLRRCGMKAEWVLMAEEINSTYANRYFMEWLQGKKDTKFTRRFEEVYAKEYGAGYADRIRDIARNAEMIIYSLGVAPCFFEKESGEFALTFGENLNAALAAKSFNFRTTTVKENVDNLMAMIEILREFNPQCHIVLTVSPVPLKATFERSSALIADNISKSTLRVVAHEIMEMHLPRVHYWPSFEIVKQIGCHMGPMFGVDDDSPLHLRDDVINTILDSFLRVFAESDVVASNTSAQAVWDRVGVGAGAS